ncbi:MAG: efflux RND transporter periplasmic adaptor subunit [Anaerolineae bacterium]|nr:efflux RND transporter periplasmic adaptor subunit [Anaerolineae bacterium]
MKKILFSLLVLLSLSLAACGAEPTATPETPIAADETVIAEGRIIPAADVVLTFAVRGTVEEILVSEGQSVKSGDVLARLSDREQAQAALAASNLELTSAQQAYDEFTRAEGLSRAEAWDLYLQAQIVRAEFEREWEKLDLSSIEDKVEDADADVQDKEEDLEDAQDEFDKYKDLNKDNSKRKTAEDDLEKAQEDYNESLRKREEIVRERDSVRATLDAALANEAEAKRIYDQRAEGLDPDQKALLEARLANAKAQAAAAQSNLDNFDLKAPFDGIVTDINLTVGQLVGPENQAIQLADFSAWMIETSDLNELEVVRVSEGQTVEVRPDALGDLVLDGVVEQVGLSYRTQGGDVLYTVRIKLNETDERLRWGMTVELTFAP